MKKKILTLAFLIFLSVFVASQQIGGTQYCEASLSQYSQQERLDLGITPEMVRNYAPCLCYNSSPQFSEWSSDYCIGGKLQQTRFVYVLRRPQCDIFQRTTEKQFLVDERCEICPEPVSIGSFQVAGCENGLTLSQRAVKAYLFDTQGVCQLKNMVELQISNQECNVAEGILLWILIGGAIATTSLLTIFLVKRKRR